MHRLPFDRPGRFYRGNLHTHSDQSDGRLGVEDVVTLYRDAGYDFLSITDHFLPGGRFGKEVEFIQVTDTSTFITDTFLTIPGAEIHGPALANGEPWHFVAIGLPQPFPRVGEQETGPQIAARAWSSGAFVAAAHPAWYSQTIDDIRPVLPYLHSIETYNHACNGVDRADGWYTLDELLGTGEGRTLTGIATDDAHFRPHIGEPVNALGGWVMVRADRLDHDAIMAGLKAGHFYSSTGPELYDVRIGSDEVIVACSPVSSIIVTGKGARSQTIHGSDLTEARLPLEKFVADGYLRVTVRDADGRRAWTNPVILDPSSTRRGRTGAI